MSTIVEATLPADQFALAETQQRFPEVEFESVRTAASGTEQIVPFIQAEPGADVDLLGALEADPTVARVEALLDDEDTSMFHVEWDAEARIVLRVLLEQDATVLDARCSNGTWWFQLLFPEHGSVGATYEVCEDHSIDLDVERVHQLSGSVRDDCVGVTGPQLETIEFAYESGYYEVPRQVTLEDLADEVDVSHQALSERFRRGHSALVENVLSRQSV